MEKTQEKNPEKEQEYFDLQRGQLYKTPPRAEKPQEYYDAIKKKFAEERDLRLKYKPAGTQEYIYELEGELARYEIDTYGGEIKPRAAINDTVECLFIGGGFSALLASAKLREYGVESIRIVERGADVGGTWYWNRYPGIACDVVSYDYLPLLDEMNYVPRDHYAKGSEIFEHCQAIAKKYDLYGLAVFQTTVTSTVWNDAEQLWTVKTDRGDTMKARFVVCANGPMSKPKLAKIDGIEDLQRPFVPYRALGLRLYQAGSFGPGRTRSWASSAPARRRCRPFPSWARRARSCMCSSAPHPPLISAMTGRPIPTGRASWSPAGRQNAASGHCWRPMKQMSRRPNGPAISPEEKSPQTGKCEHRRHDAHPPAH